jgi:hypothetical protein
VGKVTQATRERVPFIIHKADQPDVVVNFFDADGLAGKTVLKLISLWPRQMRPQLVTTKKGEKIWVIVHFSRKWLSLV